MSNVNLALGSKAEKRAFYKNALWIMLPIALQNLMDTAVNSADVIMLSYVSQNALSASSLAGQVYFIMSNLIETFLTYDKQWGDFTFGALAGHSYQKTSARSNSIDAQNFPSPSFNTVGVAAVISGVTGGVSEYALESWYGRANFAWKDRWCIGQ